MRLAGFAVSALSVALSAADVPQFVESARQSGIWFTHVNGASAQKHLVETMGSGGLLLDVDSDGWLDVFLVDGGSVTDAAVHGTARHRLFRNRGDGTFVDVSATAGIRHRDYGMGACAGDANGDGLIDIYVTNYGPNQLFTSRGDGTFVDTTRDAGVGEPRWSVSCTFADLDRDGDLDLWVVNYVDAPRRSNPYCGDARQRLRFYCHPLKYAPLPSTVYRNEGNGRFTDVSASSGVAALTSNGLGVAAADYDEDGLPDIFVANDSMPNFLFRNSGGMTFGERGLEAGIAVGADGRPRAGMGIDASDYDGDGRLDVVITNLDFEMHSLHRGLQGGVFSYTTTESGIGYPTLPFVGFGVAFLDFDNDSRLDVMTANGHILDNAPRFRPGATYEQRPLLFRNTTGRRFAEVGGSAGPAFASRTVARGLATGDIDNDGDQDALVTTNGREALLFINGAGTDHHALLVRLRGSARNREALGARVRLTAAGRTQTRIVKGGVGYASQSDVRAHFGLGAATVADRVEVTWPSGRVEVASGIAAGQIVTFEETRGIVGRSPMATPRSGPTR